MHIRAAHPHPALGVVDLQLPQPEDAAARGVRGQRGALDPAQQDMHPGGQLPHRERLGHVVVGADAEAHQHVGLVVPGGEHHHRHRTLGLDPAAHLQAVEARQHHIEDQQIGLPGLGGVHGGRAVGGRLHLETLGAQPGRDGLDDRRVVLNDQDPALGTRRGRGGAALRCLSLVHRPPLHVPAWSRLAGQQRTGMARLSATRPSARDGPRPGRLGQRGSLPYVPR